MPIIIRRTTYIFVRRIVFITFLFVLALNGYAQTTVSSKGLPVLRVNFDGKFKKGMPDYLNGTMQLTDIDGSVIEMRAQFKTRGATAQNYMMKPSFNMKLRSDDYSEEVDSTLLGIRSCSSWILDGMAIDRICMRNRVAFDIWNDFSRLPYETKYDSRNGTVGRFLEVYINDTYYGIYCLNDRINRKLLDLKKVSEEDDGSLQVRGVLYKSGTSDISPQEKPSYNADSSACVVSWHNAWELSFPDNLGGVVAWAPLQDAFANGKTTEYVKKYFYLENLVDYQILIMALSIGDNWGNKNHYLSIRNINKDINNPDPSESNRRRFVISPWDLDTSLGGKYDGSNYDGKYSEWPVSTISNNALYPVSAVIGDPEYKELLTRRWKEARKGAFSIESVNARLEGYRDLFLESGAWQRMVDHFEASKKSKPKYVVDLAREIELVEKWYESRFREMDAYFGIEDGVEMIAMPDSSDDAVYDILGRKVNSPVLSPGIYISNGRLMVVGK